MICGEKDTFINQNNLLYNNLTSQLKDKENWYKNNNIKNMYNKKITSCQIGTPKTYTV